MPKGETSAVVLGASIAGLVAARVLADHFACVTVVDRDALATTSDPRSGVPQGRHIHILLSRGQHELAKLFPGLTTELATAGASTVDAVEDWRVLLPAGWAPRYYSGIGMHTCTRPLLESIIRGRLADHPHIRIRADQEATGLLATGDGSRVIGVALRDRERTGAPGAEEQLRADLVVDATGRESRTPRWLATLGYPAPAETAVNSFVGYATRVYRRPAASQTGWQAMLLMARAPDQKRMGVIYPVEGERWLVGLAGSAHDFPPTDVDGWLAFAHGLRSQELYDAIRDLEPLSPIYGYRRTTNRLRHYEQMSRWPERLVVLGDAVCAFNPIYGQGMTVATLGALALNRRLRMEHGSSRRGFALRFQRDLAKVNTRAWLMATGEDFRWPTTEGRHPDRLTHLAHRYLDHVLLLAARSPYVHRAYFEVAHLLRPPRTLARPAILLPAAAEMLMRSTSGDEGTQARFRPPGGVSRSRWRRAYRSARGRRGGIE